MMNSSLLHLCTASLSGLAVFSACWFCSSFQLWSSILEVKPQQLVENFEQNYGSFLEGGFFQPWGGKVWKGNANVGGSHGFLESIKVLLFSGETGETPYAWFASLPGWWVCVSNLAVRKLLLLDEFDPRSFWQVNSGSFYSVQIIKVGGL